MDVTKVTQESEDYTCLYETYIGNKYKCQMVGEFSDGQISEENKEHYLIFKVEEV